MAASTKPEGDRGTFTIVTPAFNCGRFIDATIQSVVTQEGPFRLRYHVQDGGSTDGTLAALERWTKQIESDLFRPACRALEFSYDAAPDRGMYDAIQAGFAHCGIQPGGYMSWINADDILLPGALACAARLFHEFAEVQVMGGIPCLIDDESILNRIHAPQVYPRETLAAGLHDGRHLPFVMQEGTFWKNELWLKIGGVRTDLRLAGDFDLWRRFAAEADYYSVDTILGAHRRHSGQLTADHSAYFAEVDASLAPDLEQRDLVWERYSQWRVKSTSNRDTCFLGPRISCENGMWEVSQRSLPNLFNTTIYLSADGVRRSLPARFISGFLPESEPLPHLNVPRGSRWLHDGVGILQFETPTPGLHRLLIRLRSFSDQVSITIKHGGSTIFEGAPPVTLFDRDCEISADVGFKEGINTIAVYLDPPQPALRKDFLIIACEAAPLG
jgi:hypothetical protein